MPQTEPLTAGKQTTPAAPVNAPGETDEPGRQRQFDARGLLRRVALDIGPLRNHRDFRLLFTGRVVSLFGSMMTEVALPYQVYTLTHSALAVGLIGVAQLVPLLLFAFVGGALADAIDRRWLTQVTEFALIGCSGALLLNALAPAPNLWLIYSVAALAAVLESLQRPALDALVPRLVERDELAAANTLTSFRKTLGSILGPALAGVIIASVGLPGAYGVDVASFLFSLVTLRLMRAVPPPPDAVRPSLRGVIEGLRYVRSRPVLLGIYLLDFVAVFFGWPFALFPALAVVYTRHLPAIPAATALGLLYAAPAVGAFLASLTSGWTRAVHRHGLAVIVAEGAWGVALACVGLTTSLPVALACLALVGVADMASGVFRHTLSSQLVPDAMRGRVAGIELVSYTGGPLLGNIESGVAATFFSAPAAVLLGGVACALGVGALALGLPSVRRYDNRLLEDES